MRAGVAGALAVLALALPAGSSASVARTQLSLMPLPKQLLGAAGAGLPLSAQSGDVTNANAASNANGSVTAKKLSQLGRVAGYELDYGTHFGTNAGIDAISTSVQLYTSSAAASRALAFWYHDNQDTSSANGIVGAIAKLKKLSVPRVGDESMADIGVAGLKGFPLQHGLDEFFRMGSVLAQVTVVSGSAATSERIAPHLAALLAARIAAVEAGKVHGPPVSLASVKQAGPPPHGPDLSTLALTAKDVGGGLITSQGYRVDLDFSPISEYRRSMQPGGAFPSLQTTVMLTHGPMEASFIGSAATAVFASPKAAKILGIAGYTGRKVTVSGGDEAWAVLGSGQGIVIGVVYVRVGALLESVVVAARTGGLHASDLVRLATRTAARLKS